MMKKTLVVLAMGVALGLGDLAVADGATLAADKCENCHNKDGNSEHDKVPNIAGMSAVYISDTMKAYRDGDRPGKKYKPEQGDEQDMNQVAKDLSDADIEALADYYAGQTFKRHAQQTDPELVKTGRHLYKKYCRKCHEDEGGDPDDDSGLLAGQWMAYLRSQMEQFKSGERLMPKKMKKKFKKLKEGEDEALVQFFASQE